MCSIQQFRRLPMNTSDLVLKGGVGMQDRLLHVKQRLAEEAITVETTSTNGGGSWVNCRRTCSKPIDESSRFEEMNKKLHCKSVNIQMNGDPNTKEDEKPVGAPLPKPPVLANYATIVPCDASSVNNDSIDQSYHDEKLTDDESLAEKSSVCDSRIYQVNSTHQHRYPSLRTDFESFNPDERIFLEALSCIRSGARTDCNSKPEQTTFRCMPHPPVMTKHSPSTYIKQEPHPIIFHSQKTTTTSSRLAPQSNKRKRPIGPPPFTLQKVQKTNFP